MSNFDSTKENLSEILKKIVEGKLQLPDFQRGWVWDDAHIKSLLVSIARSFPVGAVMLLETGGDVKFQVRPIENVELTKKDIEPEELILDGQQRLTSLTQVLKLDKPVKTFDEKGKHISTMSSSGKDVVGIGSDFFVCLEGSWIKTYDEKCKHIATMSSSGKIVRVAAGQTFTCKEGSWMKTYDKNCKHQNTRSA